MGCEALVAATGRPNSQPNSQPNGRLASRWPVGFDLLQTTVCHTLRAPRGEMAIHTVQRLRAFAEV